MTKRLPAGNTAYWPQNILPTQTYRGFTNNQNPPTMANGWYNGMWSWSAFILPYLEAQNIYNIIDFRYRPFTSEVCDTWFCEFGQDPYASNVPIADSGNPGFLINEKAAKSSFSTFRCPSGPGLAPLEQFKDYAMNAGMGPYPTGRSDAAAQAYVGTRQSSCCAERAHTGRSPMRMAVSK
ncbi:MAG: hypothetical protein KatS3mg111_2308 [Pirellulaceae bacterium]|nr:MAG: hypothetical protein KatS3mg111_2308 [Pirellulaceae bacterium]